MEHQINGPLNVRQLIIPAKHPNYHQHLICGTAGFSDSLKIIGGRKTLPRHSSTMVLSSKLYVDFYSHSFWGWWLWRKWTKGICGSNPTHIKRILAYKFHLPMKIGKQNVKKETGNEPNFCLRPSAKDQELLELLLLLFLLFMVLFLIKRNLREKISQAGIWAWDLQITSLALYHLS